jgi:hypothetical protein
VVSKTLVLGLQHNTRRDLEAVHVAGETPQIKVLGLVDRRERRLSGDSPG